ncbi:hypothetical protein ACE01N_20220 [Saccharicrinis sp. FJH2]|uniref:hypothetical protein n=1 Tax=Saccharicrinis sp. FJH65 TaxID=3344659 RepID=UPI0035F31F41
MIELIFNTTNDFWKNFATSTATLTVGLLGFITAILTLIFSNSNNKRNHYFLLEKDKRDREDKLKKDELDFAKDKRERQRAYNRVLGCFLKVYHSYIKHKFLFNEDGISIMPDKYLIQMLDKIDNFIEEINTFKRIVITETEIIPELTIHLHELLDILSRFELLSAQIPTDPSQPDTEKMKVVFQRAHTFAVSELLDEYFTDLIEKLSKKAEVSDDFIDLMKEFNSSETMERNIKTQQEIMERMMQSLSRQLGQDVTINDFM